MFGFLLIRGDGQPNDSPALVTAGSELDRRREFSTSRRHEWRILAIDTNIDEELVGRGSTSIRFLTSRRAPFALPSRRLPFERHIYRVTAAITLVRPEDDGDFHLVLQDGAGRTMIAETPMASCDNRATLYRQRQMARARAQVRLCARASVTGVAFFDFYHGQTGVAPNAIELHPVLAFRCLTASGTPAPPSSAKGKVKLVFLTSRVRAGSNATLTVAVATGTSCAIVVSYKSGPSSAAGLCAHAPAASPGR